MKKYVLILANSIKHNPHRCVAGREIVKEGDDVRWGPWVRPVTTHDEGALSPQERKYADSSEIKPLDLVEVEVGLNQNDPIQPENWMLASPPAWSKIESATFARLGTAVEQPQNLWLDGATKADRATPSFLAAQTDKSSLYLIQPTHFHVVVRTHTWDGRSSKKLRATFVYHNRYYDLALCDPVMRQRFMPNYNVPDSQTLFPAETLICVSLTPPHRETGLHFKVVATVFEPTT